MQHIHIHLYIRIQYTVNIIHYTVDRIHYTIYSIQHIHLHITYAQIQYTVYSVQCTAYYLHLLTRIQYTLYRKHIHTHMYVKKQAHYIFVDSVLFSGLMGPLKMCKGHRYSIYHVKE